MSSPSSLSLGFARLAALLACAGAGGCGDDDHVEEPIVVRGDNGIPQCGKPIVYLNFEGVTLYRGAADDARANVSQIPDIPDEGLVIPPYPIQNEANQLRDSLYAKLAELGIPAVHARPSSGEYHMLVFSSRFLPGVQSGRTSTNCGFTNHNTVGVLNTEFYSIHGSLSYVTHGSLLVIGRAAGLDPVTGSLIQQNCMANDQFLNRCSFFTVSQTLGPCSETGQDQLAALQALSCK